MDLDLDLGMGAELDMTSNVDMNVDLMMDAAGASFKEMDAALEVALLAASTGAARPAWSAGTWLLVLWLVGEVCFWLLCRWLHARLERLSTPPAYQLGKQEMLLRMLGAVQELGPEYTAADFFSGWFLGAPYERITSGNVRSFVAWAFYAKHERALSAAENHELDDLVHQTVGFSHDLGYPLRVGPPTPGLKHVDFTLAPLESFHRPFLWYAIVSLKGALAGLVLLAAGFRRRRYAGLGYWYRGADRAGRPALGLGEAAATPRLPLFIFHGISSGIFLYVPIVLRMTAGRTTVILEQPHISMALDLMPPSRDQVLDAVGGICRRHSIQKAAFMGHSFGSVQLTWLINAKSPLVGQLLLLDPVSPLLLLPHVAYNFLYRRPKKLIEWFIYAAVSREFGIAYTLRRHFWWYENCLWLQDVPADVPVVFGLSGSDEISPASLMLRAARNMEAARGDRVRICWWPHNSHGQLLMTFSQQDGVFRASYDQEAKYLADAPAQETQDPARIG